MKAWSFKIQSQKQCQNDVKNTLRKRPLQQICAYLFLKAHEDYDEMCAEVQADLTLSFINIVIFYALVLLV